MTRNRQQNDHRITLATAAILGSASLVMLAGTAGAQSDADTGITYPKFQTLRYNEDWSEFDPSGGNDYWDSVKHIDLNEDGSNWLSIGGELRYRSETWQSFGFSPAAAADDSFALARAQVHTDWHFGDSVRVFVEGESAFASDRDLPGGRRGLDVDQFDFQNAFVDFSFDPRGKAGDSVTIRAGRQGLLYGKQRLVSTLPWANSQRSWDGVKVMYEVEGWKIDGFYTRFTPVEKYQLNDWRPGPDFGGIYATGKLGQNKDIGIDIYYLQIDNGGTVTFNGSTGSEQRHTVGSRIFGAFGDSNFGYDAEAAYQFGDVGSADVSAYMLASQFTYSFADAEWKPKVYVGLDHASGDDTAGDGDVETFNQLFPLGHAYNGFMDLIGRQNITDISAGVSFKPHSKVLVKADIHNFIRSSDGDSVYNAGGGVLRPTAPGAADDVGQEIDLTLKYSFDRHLTLQGGYSHFFAGDYFADTGASEDIDFFYMQVQYKF